MKNYTLTLIAGLLCSSAFAQENIIKQQMMKSDEQVESKIIREENNTSLGDYASFIRTQAWNSRVNAQSILKNTKELDIPIIGGRVRSSLVDKTNNIALTAPSGGGLWKFNTDGSSFSPINDLGEFLAITNIDQNPFNKKQIIIGTGDSQHGITGNGVFVSSDAGNTFTQLTSTNPITNSAFQYIAFVKYSPQTQSTIYLVSRRKLYKSTNAGTSWTEVFDAGYNDIRSLEFTASAGVMIAVEKKGVYTSTNGNLNSFALKTTGIISETAVDNIVVSSHDANRNIAYALTEKSNVGKVFKTTNGGTSWTELATPDFYLSQGWFCLTLGVHPTNPDILIGGSVGWGYSQDGGKTWTNAGGLEVDFHDIHFDASDPNVAYIGYDQGLGKVDFSITENQWVYNGTEYVQVAQIQQKEIGKNAGFNTTQIYYGDYFPQQYGDAYLEGQQDGGSFAQVNGINYRILVGDGGSMFVNKQDPKKAFGSTQKGRLYHTEDALQPSYGDYKQVGSFYNNHPNWITQFAGNNADGNQIYMADNTSIQRTLDHGANFSSIATHSLKATKVAVENNANPVVFAMGYNANYDTDIIRIANAKNSPSVSTKTSILTYNTDRNPEQIRISPNDNNTIYVTSSNGNAYEVSGIDTDNWTKKAIKGNIADVVFNLVIGVEGKPNILIAGTNVGLFYSEDGGTTWTMSNDIPHTQITDLKLRPSDNRLFVFTHGRGAWATTITPTITNLTESTSINYSVYPNPSSTDINIEIEGECESNLFDNKGKKVLSSTVKKLDVSRLSKGIYILHIYTNNELVAIEKVVID